MGPEDLLQRVVAGLEEEARRTGRVLGSRAGLVARTIAPEFRPEEFGVRTLREFIARYVPSLQVVDFSGPDPVYAIAGSQPGLAPKLDDRPGELWRVWVSPDSSRAISVVRESGDARLLIPGEQPTATELRVDPAGRDIHQRIAAEFLNAGNLPRDLVPSLRGALVDQTPTWWRRWTELLRTAGPLVFERWHEKRRAGLTAELRRMLSSGGLQGEALERATEKISLPRAGAARPARVDASKVTGSAQTDTLRDLIRTVVGEMGQEELRGLSLPVGLVLDAIAGTRR